MLFKWGRNLRRRQLLSEPFPAEWLEYLRKNVAIYSSLTEAEQAKLRNDLRVFIAEHGWEGCGGLVLTDEIKVTIAALACYLVLGMEHDYFELVPSIIVYPSTYLGLNPNAQGTEVLCDDPRLGETQYRGPVVLAWDAVLESGRHPGQGTNLVFHEFAHQLDMLNGEVDGTPPMKDHQQAERWRKVMSAEYERLKDKVEHGGKATMDPYGAQDEGEFFSVATEYFFDQPQEMQRTHKRLYELLRDYYRQDPAARAMRAQGP